MAKETVNHPAHYRPGAYEAIKVIEAWGLGFCLGNVVKYIARCGLKGSALEDLKKARWYLDRAIDGYCRACGQELEPANRGIADGCPCNSARGVNHGIVPIDTCTCSTCDPKNTGSARG